MTAEKRRICVNSANLRHRHLYVTGLRDFFPADAIGAPRRKNANGHGFELVLDGQDETVRTDIGSDAQSGKARGFLRCRGVIGRHSSRIITGKPRLPIHALSVTLQLKS